MVNYTIVFNEATASVDANDVTNVIKDAANSDGFGNLTVNPDSIAHTGRSELHFIKILYIL